ncbi:MAG: hypothetical protein AAFR93_03685 [Pseudomonadota bacterium]
MTKKFTPGGGEGRRDTADVEQAEAAQDAAFSALRQEIDARLRSDKDSAEDNAARVAVVRKALGRSS